MSRFHYVFIATAVLFVTACQQDSDNSSASTPIHNTQPTPVPVDPSLPADNEVTPTPVAAAPDSDDQWQPGNGEDVTQPDEGNNAPPPLTAADSDANWSASTPEQHSPATSGSSAATIDSDAYASGN